MNAADLISKTYGPSSFMCLALVKPRSDLASEWKLAKPGYCIFDFDPSISGVEIRWGDGSWQRIEDSAMLDDLILLPQFGDSEISELFD